MATLDVIRNLTLRAKAEGFDQANKQVRELGESYDTSAKKTLSVERSLTQLQRRYDQEFKAQQELAKVAKTLDMARAQGLVTQQRSSELMQQAIGFHNRSAQAATAHGQALQEVSTAATGMAGSLGAAGRVLAVLGPVGIAVAAALGAVTLGFTEAAKSSLDFADKAGKLVDLADTVGLTTKQLQALQIAGEKVGISLDDLQTITQRFVASLGQIREGEGETAKKLFEANEQLFLQMQAAKTTGEAFDIYLKAVEKMDVAQAAMLNKLVLGRGGFSAIRLAAEVAAVGGIDKYADSLHRLDIVQGPTLRQVDELGDVFNQNMRLIGQSIVAAFAPSVLQVMKDFSDVLIKLRNDIADLGTLRGMENLLSNLGVNQNIIQGLLNYIEIIKAVGAAWLALFNLIRNPFDISNQWDALQQAWERASAAGANLLTVFRNLRTEASSVGDVTEDIIISYKGFTGAAKSLNDASRDTATTLPKVETGLKGTGKAAKEAQTELERMRANVSALGDAATSAERYALAVAELEQKLRDGTISQETFNRAVSQLDPTVKTVKDTVTELGDSLAKAFIQGKDAAEALSAALSSVASKAASGVIKNLLTGLTGGGFDFPSIATGGVIALGASLLSGLFGGKSQAQQQQEQQAAQAQAQALAQIAQNLAAAQTALLDTATRQGAVQALQIRQATELSQAFQITRSGVLSTATANALIASLREKHNAEMLALERDFDKREFEQRQRNLIERDQLLETLGVTPALSEIGKQFKIMTDAASRLNQVLIDLGTSADEAADIVAEHLVAAIDKLRDSFTQDLIAGINALAGFDWLNQLESLRQTMRQMTADAEQLGNIDPQLLTNFFVLSAQQIINQNELVGNSFLAVVNATGLFNQGLHEFVAEIEDAGGAIVRTAQEIAAAIQSFEDQLFIIQQDTETLAGQLAVFDLQALREREQEIAAGGQALNALIALQEQQRLNLIRDFNARQAEIEQRAQEERIRAAERAAEEQRRILEEATRFLEGQIRNIQQFISHFLAGPESTLSPAQQLATAQSTFAAQYALALSGNRDALSGITGNAQDVIDAVRRYYGSTATGANIITNLLGQLGALPTLLSPEQFIVDNLTTAIETSTTGITTSIEDANADLIQALATGNLAAFATALNAHFAQLDLNLDGLLDFNEFQQGLAGMANNAQLRDMFTRLDTDNSGSISRLELINASTVGVKTGTDRIDEVEANTAATRDAQLQALTSLAALAQISNNTGNTATNALAVRQAQNTMLTRWGANTNDIFGVNIGGPFARGGLVRGPGTGTSDSILARLSSGEFVVNAAATRANLSMLEAINSGRAANDNRSIISALASLEATVLAGLKAVIAAEFEAAGVIARPIADGNKVAKRRRAA